MNSPFQKRLVVVEAGALKACETEIERYYEKMEQENRKQTIWRDDHDLWYGRDCAYEVLKRYKEPVSGKEINTVHTIVSKTAK